MTFAPRRQRGFLMVIAIFLLVVIGGMAVYLGAVSSSSQASSAADASATRAYQAARAGAEWAAYWITPAPPAKASTFKTQCDTAPGYSAVATLTLGDFTVTVTCTSAAPHTEGAGTVQWYSIVSNACNAPSAGVCPNTATSSSTYVNREVALTLTN